MAKSNPQGRNAVIQSANDEAFRRMTEADPVLIDVAPARDVVPGFANDLILTSGPPLPWSEYEGGQRAAIIGAAQFEGLAATPEEAERKLNDGEIRVAPCGDFACVGSLAGVYSASMPVFVVRNEKHGNLAYCNMYEGSNPRRLNYGIYDDGVRQRLGHINNVIAPVIGAAVRASGGVPLKSIMARALRMGDELHSRNTAASLIFSREIFPHLLKLSKSNSEGITETVDLLTEDNYFFLRLSMAASKTMADASHGVEHSTLVSAMGFNCRHFGIRVSGLGDRWFTGPHPEVKAKFFEGYGIEDIAWMGGESTITETVGLGGFSQAAAFALQAYQGGSPEAMVEINLGFYQITHGEHPDFKIPFLGHRGSPAGIDIFKVMDAGVTPAMDIGIAGKGGGQIGAGLVRARMPCFEAAAEYYRSCYENQ